jgi:alpha-beta hydrolase superfamily lysophospholipase
MSTGSADQPKTIVLIPGLWLTALSWEHWVDHYNKRGFNVIAKSWPGMDGDLKELRDDHSAIDDIGFGDVVDHYEGIVRELGSPPIIMGHSFGGAVTQVLLDRGVGAVGVAIDPAPIKGVLRLPPASLRSAFPALKNPANRHRAVMLTPEEFHYAFTNTLDDEEAAEAYERYAAPGPGKTLFEAALANFNPHAPTTVHFHNDDRAPLLLIAGQLDHVVPATIVRTEAKLQRKSKAITGYKEFSGRSHYIVGQDGWEEVADYALGWALNPTNVNEPI